MCFGFGFCYLCIFCKDMCGCIVYNFINFFNIVNYIVVEYGFNLLVVFFSVFSYDMFVK